MRRRTLLATIALLGAMIGSILLGSGAQANAEVPDVGVAVNRGW